MAIERLRNALASLASLGDPVRRRLYEAVALEGRELNRNELAGMTGVARPLAAYHLDRLVKDGLLTARFERQSGRKGPGAGRPAKLYSRARSPLQLMLPPRDYELAARVMAEAIARGQDPGMLSTLHDVARDAGGKAAQEHSEAVDISDAAALQRLLRERGYEPRSNEAGVTWLKNCVFDPLAVEQPQLVCGMNLALMQGVLEGLPEAKMTAKLDPAEGRCCVVLVPDEPGDPAA